MLLRKLMEEAFEVSQAQGVEEIRWEVADTLYFLSVLAVGGEVCWSDILAELRSRHRGD